VVIDGVSVSSCAKALAFTTRANNQTGARFRSSSSTARASTAFSHAFAALVQFMSLRVQDRRFYYFVAPLAS
jgi:hypothetical protein